MTNRYLYITLLAVLGFNAETMTAQVQGQVKDAPRIVVSITIDQLRSDYLEAFMPLYSDKGFQRLLNNGRIYTNATYPFTPIDRASATAAIYTGTTPYYNNIIGQRWLNRKTLRPVGCVDDAKYTGVNTTEKTSPNQLVTSTIGDELKIASGGKAIVYAIAPFRDAAVLSAGHAANSAIWIDDHQGTWCSTSYYSQALPLWVQAYNRLSAPRNMIGSTEWEPHSLLGSNYSYLTQGGEVKPFKHKFSGTHQFQLYKTSALVNADITNMAMQCVTSSGMGNDKVTDLLCLTYYAGTYDRKTVTDCQLELQDTYIRLDNELGRLMTFLEEKMGRDNVLYVITSTGHFDEEIPDYSTYKIPSGTFYMARTANLMNMYLGASWGQGNYVETTYRNHIFLNRQLLETKKISIGDALSRSQEFLAMMSGVRNVYTSLQLLTSQNEQLLKVRNGYTPDNCGDIVIETAPGWTITNEDTKENEISRASFTQFPIIFFGSGIHAERILTPVTIDQIAPTVARSIRIRAPNACFSKSLF